MCEHTLIHLKISFSRNLNKINVKEKFSEGYTLVQSTCLVPMISHVDKFQKGCVSMSHESTNTINLLVLLKQSVCYVTY